VKVKTMPLNISVGNGGKVLLPDVNAWEMQAHGRTVRLCLTKNPAELAYSVTEFRTGRRVCWATKSGKFQCPQNRPPSVKTIHSYLPAIIERIDAKRFWQAVDSQPTVNEDFSDLA